MDGECGEECGDVEGREEGVYRMWREREGGWVGVMNS